MCTQSREHRGAQSSRSGRGGSRSAIAAVQGQSYHTLSTWIVDSAMPGIHVEFRNLRFLFRYGCSISSKLSAIHVIRWYTAPFGFVMTMKVWMLAATTTTTTTTGGTSRSSKVATAAVSAVVGGWRWRFPTPKRQSNW